MWRISLIVVVIMVGLLLLFQFFFRYKIFNNDGKFYRYDRLSGRFSHLVTETSIKEPSERVIDLVKKSPYRKGYVEYEIQKELQKLTGNIKYNGWKANKIDNNTYLVSCTFVEANQEKGWWWEVDFRMEIARPIIEAETPSLDIRELNALIPNPQGKVLDYDLAKKYKLIAPIEFPDVVPNKK